MQHPGVIVTTENKEVMTWFDSYPPTYIWPGDKWFNIKEQNTYSADIESFEWVDKKGMRISFPKKTMIFLDGKFVKSNFKD